MSIVSESSTIAESPARPAIRRLLIVRLGAMGDIIHTLPAVTALRQAFPLATFGWVVEQRWAELLCTLPTARCGPRSAQRPLVERVHLVNTARWRSAKFEVHTWEQIAAAVSDLRAAKYDTAVDFQGAIRSALIAKLSGAPVIYGFAHTRESEASMFYTREVFAGGRHVVEQNMSLAEQVAGLFPVWVQSRFPQDAAAQQDVECWLQKERITDFAIITPGAGWGAKRWPAERYAEVARRLGGKRLHRVINAGPGEHELAAAICAAAGGGASVFTGSLSRLIALMQRARLFIGGDTGPLHLAAALKVPVVAIFGPTNPVRNGPFGTRSIVLRSPVSVTSHRRHERTEEGMLEITPEQVLAAAQDLLWSARG